MSAHLLPIDFCKRLSAKLYDDDYSPLDDQYIKRGLNDTSFYELPLQEPFIGYGHDLLAFDFFISPTSSFQYSFSLGFRLPREDISLTRVFSRELLGDIQTARRFGRGFSSIHSICFGQRLAVGGEYQSRSMVVSLASDQSTKRHVLDFFSVIDYFFNHARARGLVERK
ncbi:MAG TPA: hypothetical protein VJK51_01755 [Candidatus Nanoarchaeia archaeon]|nr:hypothetical protein [Candidatus Nanoarchaeia archaeon]